MTKEKAKDILREAVSYIVNQKVDGLEEFKKDVNDMEDFIVENFLTN